MIKEWSNKIVNSMIQEARFSCARPWPYQSFIAEHRSDLKLVSFNDDKGKTDRYCKFYDPRLKLKCVDIVNIINLNQNFYFTPWHRTV